VPIEVMIGSVTGVLLEQVLKEQKPLRLERFDFLTIDKPELTAIIS
jgi:hypothetical protein